MDLVLREYRNNELVADFNSIYSEPVLSTSLEKIEKFVAKTYTRNVFKEIKLEIKRVGALNVELKSEDEHIILLNTNAFGHAEDRCSVIFDKHEKTYSCDCRLFENRGYPCRHIFSTMRHMHIEEIPTNLVYKRWTKNAKSELIDSFASKDTDYEKTVKMCQGALAADCNQLCNLACKSFEDFTEIRNDILNLIRKLQMRQGLARKHTLYTGEVADPLVVKTKDAPTKTTRFVKRKHCSKCKRVGHTYRKCPRFEEPILDNDEQNKDEVRHKFDAKLNIGKTSKVKRMKHKARQCQDKEMQYVKLSDGNGKDRAHNAEMNLESNKGYLKPSLHMQQTSMQMGFPKKDIPFQPMSLYPMFPHPPLMQPYQAHGLVSILPHINQQFCGEL
ncbi:hypothetical protein PIB30_117626 [Stylosanthes scabra]|uniref:Protein FAR1-RELATED SEQUENCE n=1 Tax=Stylosanthes scabra TaxID=79078 RepID=A0ABU6ZED3_9FABA|nr:hypothetical protein [Stylosanthes scabra]